MKAEMHHSDNYYGQHGEYGDYGHEGDHYGDYGHEMNCDEMCHDDAKEMGFTNKDAAGEYIMDCLD